MQTKDGTQNSRIPINGVKTKSTQIVGGKLAVVCEDRIILYDMDDLKAPSSIAATTEVASSASSSSSSFSFSFSFSSSSSSSGLTNNNTNG